MKNTSYNFRTGIFKMKLKKNVHKICPIVSEPIHYQKVRFEFI